MAVVVASSSELYTVSPPGSITKPSGVAVGDLLILIVFGKWNGTSDATCSGFTEIGRANDGGQGVTVLKRIADASDVSASNYSVTNDDGEIQMAYMLRITGHVDDTSQITVQTGVTDGIFGNLDITPAYANSLIIFAMWNVAYTGSDLTGWAIAVSNPSWTEAQKDIGNNGNAFGPTAVVWSNRPEVTSTGDFSITDPGADQQAIALVIPPLVNASVSPDVIEAVGSVQAPTVAAAAVVAPAVVEATLAVQAPVVSLTPPKWVNIDKNVESFVNVAKN